MLSKPAELHCFHRPSQSRSVQSAGSFVSVLPDVQFQSHDPGSKICKTKVNTLVGKTKKSFKNSNRDQNISIAAGVMNGILILRPDFPTVKILALGQMSAVCLLRLPLILVAV